MKPRRLWLLLRGNQPVLATKAKGVKLEDVIYHGWEGDDKFTPGPPPGWRPTAKGKAAKTTTETLDLMTPEDG